MFRWGMEVSGGPWWWCRTERSRPNFGSMLHGNQCARSGRALFVLSILCFFRLHGTAQQLDWTLVDAERNDREIPLDVRFNSDWAEQVPLVVLAHGFVMQPVDYDDVVTGIVEAGMAVALLGTETGLAPSHVDYGLDMAFVAEHLHQEVGGALEGLLNGDVAFIGHSMGGGASWLGAAELGAYAGLRAVVGWAPAETVPSSIAAAADVEAPTLLISGSADAITTPAQHHQPLFDGLTATDCRAFASLIGGGHCGFADAGTLCDIGELGFSGMSREEQQAHTLALTVGWLQAHLFEEPQALDVLQAYAGDAENVELDLECAATEVASISRLSVVSCHPNPAERVLHVSWPSGVTGGTVFTHDGRAVVHWSAEEGPTQDISSLEGGAYFLVLEGPGVRQVMRFCKMP